MSPIMLGNRIAGHDYSIATLVERLIMAQTQYNYQSLLQMPPLELLDWLAATFLREIPEQIDTVEEMEEAASILAQLSNDYAYLMALLSYAKILTREYKRSNDKKSKTEDSNRRYEDAVDRKEIIDNIASAIKQQYAAVSRAVTIKCENNTELRMNGEGSIRARRQS